MLTELTLRALKELQPLGVITLENYKKMFVLVKYK